MRLRLVTLGLLGLWLTLAGGLPAPALAELRPGQGVLLVARDGLTDPRFRDTVVLLIQHDQQGTVGVILNRPSRLALAELLPEQAALFGGERVLSYGGPVMPKGLLALVQASSAPPHPAREVLNDVFVTGVEELLDWLPAQPAAASYRVFAGYAGWAEGQLDGELAQGDWRLLPAEPELLFQADGEGLWRRLREVRLL